nr:facilitated trehalose transporter Tret1-like isoform X1 [Leptinotarsa decemlineata]
MIEKVFFHKGTLFQVFVSFTVNMIALTDGMAGGWTAPMIPYFLSEKSHIKMTRNAADWLETSMLIGALVGLPNTFYLVRKFGRRKSLMFALSTVIVCWILIAVGDRVEYLYVARFFSGAGLNMAFVAVPMYISEISHKNIRGFLSSIGYVMMLVGVLIMYSVGPFLAYFVSPVIAISLLGIELVVCIFLPESPYYLLTLNRYEDARISSSRFRDNPAEVEVELKDMIEAIEAERNENQSSIKDLFLVNSYRKSLIIMIVLNTAQQLSSFEVILMNIHEILESAGSIYIESSTAAIIFSAIMLVASCLAALLMDNLGRKFLLILSSVLTGISLSSLGTFLNLKLLGFNVDSVSWIPVVSVMMYAAVFKFGLGIVPSVLCAEIFSPKIKAFGLTAADGVYVASSVVALQLFLQLKETVGIHWPFYIFSCCSFLTSLFVAMFVPETKGKTFEEIRMILEGKSVPNHPVEISCGADFRK